MIQRSRFAEEEGISLVEMLVAVVILGIIMSAMATSLMTSLQSAQGQERQIRATALVSEILEEAAGLSWGDTGLCESAATAHFGGSSFTYADGASEPLVTLDDSEAICQASSGHPLVPVRAVTRSGVTYELETVVSWTDDPQDGLGLSDPDTTEDLKHIRVQATWQHRGADRQHSNETYLAPAALLQEISAEVRHAAGADFTYLDPSTSLTQSETTLRVVTVRPQSAISVDWVLADGSNVSNQAMSAVDSSRLVWELVIPDGSPDVIINRLSNGETRFNFTATDAASAFVVTVVKRGLFLIHPDGMAVTWADGPPAIRVTADGTSCPYTVAVYVRGALSSDVATATWSTSPSVRDGLVAAGTDAYGATFERSYGASAGLSPGDQVDLTVDVERVTDGAPATLTHTFTVQPLEEGQSC